ncbi:MAG: DUF4263 domain-containing protein [Desulfovibrionales bacterium]|nr:DUF4263 domain-containing protein [Desulfovibrionales bacterium]
MDYPEKIYHDFLKRHANLFLVDGLDSYFAISKLKLGSELEIDFGIPYEDHSRGLFWELIEIKRPQTAPYTEAGVPSAKLTEATQQIRDWKRWIRTSRSEARKLFSLWSVRSVRQPNFRYTIVIGTRKNSEKWLNERNQYAEENGVRVRSFDYLTDRVKQRVYRDKAFVGSGNWDEKHPELCVELANPFIEAFTDSQWKRLLREPDVCGPHFIANSCKKLLAHWRPNAELLSTFNDGLRQKAQQQDAG